VNHPRQRVPACFRPSRLVRVAPLAVCTWGGLLGGGCSAPPSVEDGAPAPDATLRATTADQTPVATVDPSEPQGLSPLDLAEQARRDVEMLLAGTPDPAPSQTEAIAMTTADTPPPPPARQPAPDAIDWIVPDHGADHASAAQTMSPTPLGRPDEALDAGGATPAGPPDGGPDETATAEAMVSDDTPNAPDLTTDRVGALMVDLSGELYRQSTYADVPIRELMVIAAQAIVRPDRVLTTDAFLGLTPRERELLNHFQAFCQQLGRELETGEDAEAIMAEAVGVLRAALVEEPRLVVLGQSLCYHVGGFGDYEPFHRYSFLAHEKQQVILYLEVDDFSSELNERGDWVTELGQQLVIYSDRDGIPVWTDDWQPVVDRSKKRRRDFFTVQVITLPEALSVGRYHLKVRLRDEKSGAEAETSIPFEMVADAKLATSVP
jgi:hypothetical protein